MTSSPEVRINFAALTPDFMWSALSSIGIRAESGFLALNSYENRVYQFSDEEKRRWVVKFYRPERWTKEQIIEEHLFSAQLMAQDIPVIAPYCVESRHGVESKHSLDGETLYHYQGYYFALFISQGGRQFEVDNLDGLEQVGRNLGRIHLVGKNTPFIHRKTMNMAAQLQLARQNLIASQCVPNSLESRFFNALDELMLALNQTPFDNYQTLRLHGDCHAGNILWRDGPVFVDFDDTCTGPAIQDIWMMLNGSTAEQRLQLDVILEAYSEFCTFDSQQLKLIEPLRGLRVIYYMSWIAKRWHDPAFPKAFPWFGDGDYWLTQIKVCQQQLDDLQCPTLTLMPQW